jgi:glycosyltransferase involved in cell wall biosynthesis
LARTESGDGRTIVLRQTRPSSDSGLRVVLPGKPWPGVTTAWQQVGKLERALPDLLEQTKASVLHLMDPLVCPRPRPGLKIVATLYDLIPLIVPEHRIGWREDFGRVRWHYHRTFLRRLASVDALIVLSNAVADDLVEHLGVERSRIHVIPPGADEAPLVGGADGSTGISEPYFLFVGAAEKRKNVDSVIKALAFSKLPHKLVLAGKLGRGNADRLMGTAAHCGISDRVVLTGFVSDAELASLYRRADALVFPSLSEGYGLPVLEAMREECPVLTSNRGSLSEAAADAAVLVDPTSMEAIADGLGRVAQDPSLRAQLRALGVDRCRQLTWDAAAQAIRAVWMDVGA